MIRTIGRFTDEKEDKLTLERFAFRFIDYYGTQDVFFADPYLEQQLINWPVTLITTEDKKRLLIKRVKNSQKHLLYPIHVIYLQEAKALTENGTSEFNQVILPLHYKEICKSPPLPNRMIRFVQKQISES